MKIIDVEKPETLKNKFFRVISKDQDEILCLPGIGAKHVKFSIPKNAIVKITDFNVMRDVQWFEVEYNGEKYLFSSFQITAYFIPIKIRNG